MIYKHNALLPVYRDGKDTGERIVRTIYSGSGWLWARCRGKRYQVMGGISTPYYLSLDLEV